LPGAQAARSFVCAIPPQVDCQQNPCAARAHGWRGPLVPRRKGMSRQEIAAVRLSLFALFLTFLIIASLLANVTPLPRKRFPVQQHHNGDSLKNESGMVDSLAVMARKSFSDLWAYYAPYCPAATFKDATREGCLVSQVNIVSRYPHTPCPGRSQSHSPATTSRCPVPHLGRGKANNRRAYKAPSSHELQ
jgi:hypothetical protein